MGFNCTERRKKEKKRDVFIFRVRLTTWAAGKPAPTCILLRPHWSIDHPLESGYPIPLLGFGLAGEEELPVRRDDGDPVVPMVALRGWGQARQNGVAVLLTADEHLTPGVGIL